MEMSLGNPAMYFYSQINKHSRNPHGHRVIDNAVMQIHICEHKWDCIFVAFKMGTSKLVGKWLLMNWHLALERYYNTFSILVIFGQLRRTFHIV